MAWTDHPYDASGYLYLLQPTVVLKARVNLASASYPLAAIPYDGVTVGEIADVEMGMTVLIGTSDGAADLGRTYARGDADHDVGDASSLNIGYSSRGRQIGQVDLQDDAYITVIDLFEVWKRPARAVDGTGILRDYGLTALGLLPIANMGGSGGMAQMDFVDGGDILTLSFDSAASTATAPGQAIVTTAWDVKDGTITVGDADDVAITATFPPGARWIKLVQEQTDGALSLPRRRLVVALEDEDDTLLTAHRARWTLKPEGARFTCDLKQRLDPADYLPGTVAIWLVKERYAGVDGSQTGFAVKFAGYVERLRSRTMATREGMRKVTTVEAVDAAGRLAALRALPSTVARETTPANSSQIAGATLDRYLWWLLSWHSSIPMLADFHTQGETRNFTRFSSPGGDLYRAADALARAGGNRLTMDSRGRLLVRSDPMRQDAGSRTSTVLRALTPDDLSGIERAAKPFGAVGVMRATATLHSTRDASSIGEDEAIPDIHAVAPGDVEGQGAGEEQNAEPWQVASQEELNGRLGHDFERRNAYEDDLRLQLAHGGDGGIEPALMQWISVTTDDDTTGWADAALTAERCLPHEVSFEYDDFASTMKQSVTAERETVGTPGIFEAIAGPDTRLTPDARGFLPAYGEDYFSIDTNGYLCYTRNTGVNWLRANMALADAVIDWVTDPWSPKYAGGGTVVQGWVVTETKIYGFAWDWGDLSVTVDEQFTFSAPAVFGQRRIECERGVQNFVAVVSAIPGTGTLVTTTTDGATWGTEVQVSATAASYAVPGLFVSPRVAGKIVTSESVEPPGMWDGMVSLDYGASFSGIASPNIGGSTGGAAHGLSYPFDDNDDEDVCYYGTTTIEAFAAGEDFLWRIDGAVQTDISPQDGGRSWGAQFARSIDTCPIDATRLMAVLRNGVDNATSADDTVRLYHSSDRGDSWDGHIADVESTISTGFIVFARAAGDDPEVGFAGGTGGRLWRVHSDDGSAENLYGDLGDFTSPSVGTFMNLAG